MRTLASIGPQSTGKWWPSGKAFNLDALVREPPALSAILGLTRMGKGQFTKFELIPAYHRAKIGVVAIDVDDEYSIHGKVRRYTSLGPLQHRVHATEFESWCRANKDVFLSKQLGLSIVCSSPKESGDEIADQVLSVLPVLKARGELAVIMEELPRWAKAKKAVVDMLTAMATGWLKEEIAGWLVSQAYRGIPIDVRSQVSRVISFLQVDSADVGFVAHDCGRGFAAEMIQLEPGNFLARNRREANPEVIKRYTADGPPEQEEET